MRNPNVAIAIRQELRDAVDQVFDVYTAHRLSGLPSFIAIGLAFSEVKPPDLSVIPEDEQAAAKSYLRGKMQQFDAQLGNSPAYDM